MGKSDLKSRKKESRLLKILVRPLRSKRVVLILVVLIPTLAFITFSNKGIIQRLKLEAEKREWEQKNKQAQLQEKRLKEEIKALESDLGTIERIARERYGMVREGETVYLVKPDK
jgi:cell division protein FtsB